MRRLPLPFAILTLATLFVPATGCVADPEPEVQVPDTVIVNARVIDGTAAPAKMVAVRIRGDRIAEVGEVRLARATDWWMQVARYWLRASSTHTAMPAEACSGNRKPLPQ